MFKNTIHNRIQKSDSELRIKVKIKKVLYI